MLMGGYCSFRNFDARCEIICLSVSERWAARRTKNVRSCASCQTTDREGRPSQLTVRHRAVVSNVRAAGFNDAEITEVVANVAVNIYTNYFNHVAQTVVDFPPVEIGPV